MPRQVPLSKKIEWTDLADSGLSVAEIRSLEKNKPDPRTISSSIEQVRGQRRRAHAKEIALQQGLKEHWHLLLEKLELLPTLEFEWSNFDWKPVFALKTSKLKGQGWSATRGQTEWIVNLTFEHTIEFELLKEHLPSDTFWSLMTTFKRDLGEALGARLAFAEAVISEVENSTNLSVTEEESDPGLVLAGLARLDQFLEDQAIKDDISGLNLKIEDGVVWFQNSAITKSTDLKADSLKVVIENAVNGLRGEDAWKGLLAAAAKVERTTKTLANETAVLQLSTVLPGECRSCARYSV